MPTQGDKRTTAPRRGHLALALCGLLASPAWGGEPQGLPHQLAAAGVTPSLLYNGEVAANVAGGLQRGQGYVGTLHMQLALDGAKITGTPGLSGFLDALWATGGKPSSYAGDAQGVSDLAASPGMRLYEAWLEYNFAGNRFSILGGRYDLNTEFYHVASAGMFLNASFGIGPEFSTSGFSGPSIFPDTSLAVRLAYKPAPRIVVQTAVLDGAPLDRLNGSPPPFDPHNGVLLIAETAYINNGASDGPQSYQVGRAASQAPYDDKFALGAWLYTARLGGYTTPARVPVPGEAGAYMLVDHLLLQAAGDPKRRLSGFIQLGVANQAVNRFGLYFGAGLVASGIYAPRPDDQLGIAIAVARNGSGYTGARNRLGQPVSPAETTLEISYQAQIQPWILVQPDVQYVIHPNTSPAIPNATVLQLRTTVTF